jgi:hypothetical protein
MAPLWGGEYTLERLAGGIIPRFPLWCRDPPDGPPQRSFVGQFPRALGSIPGHYVTDFYRFFGLSWENTTSMLLFDMHADFFSEFDLRGITSSKGRTFRAEFRFFYSEVVGGL